MFKEQLNLFGEDAEEKIIKETEKLYQPEVNQKLTYLPQVKWEESYYDITDLAELEAQAQGCSLCRLRDTCKNVIFGEGKPDARLMLIGEGPGKDEDDIGRPFVGKAGQLLDKILLAAEIPRSEVYIANVIKCRPPSNRLPKPDEVKVCQNYLEAQIRLIKPDIIVCLGALASSVVIDKNARITKIRGNWYKRHTIRIMPTFHPAALLRNEDYKRPVWEDFKIIRDEYKKL
ncbi:MAG: uracil-DNA glycosylase [Syntrophomonadaceae bacterium]|nr:uracil-DNA glycosylase [Syntrophomonadaceae bacterium]